MDFIGLLAGTEPATLIQIGCVAIVIFLCVITLPKLLSSHSTERQQFIEMIEKRDEKFFEVIESYRDALLDFQKKEDESHHQLAEMLSDCRVKVAAEHKELMRALKAIAKKLDADIIE